jgi:CBS domain-containing membrane protein
MSKQLNKPKEITMKVRDLMTKDVFTLRSDHKLDLANDIMGWQRIRHIPVVDAMSNLVGLITHRDLLRAAVSSLANISAKEQKQIYGHIRISEVMTPQVATIGPDTNLSEAAAMMIEKKLGCLPVLEGRKLVGIITESDFLTLAWQKLK